MRRPWAVVLEQIKGATNTLRVISSVVPWVCIAHWHVSRSTLALRKWQGKVYGKDWTKICHYASCFWLSIIPQVKPA